MINSVSLRAKRQHAKSFLTRYVQSFPDHLRDAGAPVSLEEFFSRLQDGESKSLNLVVKADVQGSLEPIVNSLEQLTNDEVTVEILRASTGNVSESDVMLASASEAIILGFNVGIDSIAKDGRQ